MSKLTSNFFFAFLITLVSLWVGFSFYQEYYLTTPSNQENFSQAIKLRILESQPDNFGRLRYFALADQNLFIVEAKEPLPRGRLVQINGEIKYFGLNDPNLSNFQRSLKSLGVLGEIKTIEIVGINWQCDWLCQYNTSQTDWRNYINATFNKSFCAETKEIIKSVLPNFDCAEIVGLSRALTLGQTNYLSSQTRENLRLTGLSHLVAVSGFHLVLVLGFMENLVNRLNFSLKSRFVLICFGVLLVWTIIGARPSVLRSGLSILISGFALKILGRKIEPWRVLAYSAMILLLLNPFYLVSVSFQLSFLASLALVLGFQVEQLSEIKFFSQPGHLLVSGFWIFLFTLPVLNQIFGQAALGGVVFNILAIPLASLILPLNLVGLIPYFGELFLFFSAILQIIFLSMVEIVATVFPAISLPQTTYLEIFVYYLVLFTFLFLLKTIQKFKLAKSLELN